MKIITDYFSSPPTKHKKLNTTDILVDRTDSVCNSITTTGESDGDYYPTRKIKIRLADPNVPDSYVCEVYDTSVEEENIPASLNEPEKSCAFNILMAGKGKGSKTSPSKKRTRQNPLGDGHGTDSSDDESLIFVKKRLKTALEIEDRGIQIKENMKIKGASVSSGNRENDSSEVTYKRRSLRKKDSVKNTDEITSIEHKNLKKDIESDNTLICNAASGKRMHIETNQSPLRDKRLKKNESSIEKYFMPSSKSVSKKGNNSKVQDGFQLQGSMSQSTIKLNKGIIDLKNNDCVVVLEKLSIPPMFKKNSKKAPIDPDVLKARQAFLHKGLPKVLVKKLSKEKLEEKNVQFFPLISHVLQSCDNSIWKKRKIDLSLKDFDCQYNPEICWKQCINSQNSMKHLTSKIKRVANAKVHLKNLISTFKSIEVKKLYDVLSEIRDSHSNNQICTIWSNKYKLKSSDFLSNEQTVKKLEKWLLSWKNFGENIKSFTIKQRGESSDDFVSSDEDEPSNAPITACLLQGPVSSGKTALVQALAAELDFHILEINCSAKRSGKRMLADLQEATKSHKILQEANGNVGTSLKGEKMAIIVVEEADIIFDDHDDGFICGLQTLIAYAKRPVILLTSEPSAAHLEKFRSSHTMQLKLVRLPIMSSCALLELIALVEGTILPRSAILKMLSLNNCDLRKCLLQLQFWVQHGSPNPSWPIINHQSFTTGRMWWLSHQLLFKSDLRHSGTTTVRNSDENIMNKTNEESTEESSGEVPTSLACYDYFENLSICDLLQGNAMTSNMEITNFDVKIKDSSCLSGTLMLENSNQKIFQNQLVEEILQRNLNLIKNDSSKINLHDIPVKNKRWLTTQLKASDELNRVVPKRLSNMARHCDYLPLLRELCRVEQKRKVDNSKRGNRFYHYIKTLGGSPTPANLNINCSILFPDV